MSKDTLWFRHDSNAKDDPKCMLLIDRLGMEGYGVYWALLEVLREQPDYRYPLIVSALARRYNTSEQVMKSVIYDFGLFTVDEEKRVFFSDSLVRRMESYDSIKASRSLAGKISADKRKAKATSVEQIGSNQDAPDEQMLNKCSTSVQQVLDKCSTNAEQVSNICSTNRIELNRIELNRIDKSGLDIVANANAFVSAEKNSADPEDAREEQIFADFGSEASTDEEKQQVNFDSENSEEQQDNSANTNEKVLTPRECQKVSDYWNKEVERTGANVGKVAAMSDPRQNKIRIRWKEFAKVGPANDVFREIVRQVCGSKFLQGDNNRGWKCTFDWIFENGKNWVKVYEGNYANQQQDGNSQAGRRQQMTQQDELKDLQMHPNKLWNGSVDVEIDDEAKAVIESLNKRE